jgi:hypothetical protein
MQFMKKNNIVSIIVCALGILGAAIALTNYVYNLKHPPMHASEMWGAVKASDLKSITISPLLSKNSIQGKTIDKTLAVEDDDLIYSIWGEMQGKEKRSKHAPGHWSYIKGIKITYNLASNSKFAFRVTFNVTYDVADYYMLDNFEDNFYVPNFARKGSAKLFDKLSAILESNDVDWVPNNPEYWNIGNVPRFKGKGPTRDNSILENQEENHVANNANKTTT